MASAAALQADGVSALAASATKNEKSEGKMKKKNY